MESNELDEFLKKKEQEQDKKPVEQAMREHRSSPRDEQRETCPDDEYDDDYPEDLPPRREPRRPASRRSDSKKMITRREAAMMQLRPLRTAKMLSISLVIFPAIIFFMTIIFDTVALIIMIASIAMGAIINIVMSRNIRYLCYKYNIREKPGLIEKIMTRREMNDRSGGGFY